MAKVPSSLRVVRTSFLVDVLDILLNVAVAIASGSTVMLAQALRGGADLLTSGLLLVGLKRSRRRANRKYAFGYGREIFFWTLMSGIMMVAVTATVSFREGWQQFAEPEVLSHLPVALTVLAIGLAANWYALLLSIRRLRSNNQSVTVWGAFTGSVLVETKATFVLDLMGSLGGILGLVSLCLSLVTGNQQFDGLGAMFIGVMTAVLALLLILDVKDLLVGRSADPELESEIRAVALAIKGVEGVLDLRTMYIGSERLLVNMELDVDQKLQTAQLEQLMDIVKAEVKDKVPTVHHIQIELETPHWRRKHLSLSV